MPMQKLGGKLYMIRTAQLAGLSERVVPIFQTDHRNAKAEHAIVNLRKEDSSGICGSRSHPQSRLLQQVV